MNDKRMNYEEMNEMLNKLSYTMQKKSYRLMELKVALNETPRKFKIPAAISYAAGCYTAVSYENYLNYALTTFSKSNSIYSNVKVVDLAMPVILISGIAALYLIELKRNSIRKEYEQLRKDIIKNINNSLCNCAKPCSCKDNYIKVMESLGIDLVF